MIKTKISPQKPTSRWVAVSENNTIVSEGVKPETVIKKAKKTGSSNFYLAFVPKKDITYIL